MSEQGKLRAGFLRGVNQAVHTAEIHVVQMPVRQQGGYRTKLHHQAGRRLGGVVAVAANVVKRNVRKGPQKGFRIPLIVPQMHEDIRRCFPHGLHHGGGDAVGIGKDGDFHGSPSFFEAGIS